MSKLSPEEMEAVGGVVKVTWFYNKHSWLKEELDRRKFNGKFLNSTKMAQDLGLPHLSPDSNPFQRVNWCIKLAKANGVDPKVDLVSDVDGRIYVVEEGNG